MPYYEYESEDGQRVDQWFEMGEAPEEIPVFVAGKRYDTYRRVYGFNFVEDRRRMRSGRSAATGLPYAQSRRDERLLEKQLDCEFITPKEMPEKWRHLREYAQHVKHGGSREAPEAVNPQPQESLKGSLMREADRRGISFT